MFAKFLYLFRKLINCEGKGNFKQFCSQNTPHGLDNFIYYSVIWGCSKLGYLF